MDSLVGTLIGMLFGSIGAGIIWAFKRGTVPYKEILYSRTTLSDIVGVSFITLIGLMLYIIIN